MSRRNGRHAPTKTTGFRFDVHYHSLLTEKATAYGMSPGRYARQVLMEHLTHADQEAAQLALARLEALVGSVRDEVRQEVRELRDTLLAFLGHVEVVDELTEVEEP